ncbi:MAG TPA: amino acid ABC transporter permease [Stellaceae bacterium]|nr:amino acid ABC transporter permease [Stellaceae bacterium]
MGTSLDFSWLADPVYQRWLLEGLGNTITLAALSSVMAVAIGVVGAFLLLVGGPGVRGVVRFYIELFRNTPPVLQMLFLYFTLTSIGVTITDPKTGSQVPLLSAYACALVSLSLFGGALAIEAFRSGLEAVPAATIEAGRSLGYTRAALFRRVQLPIAARICLPSLTNILTNLFKTTSQASIITVPELLYYAGQIYTENFRTLEVMLLVLMLYVSLVTVLAAAMGRVERALAFPGYGG